MDSEEEVIEHVIYLLFVKIKVQNKNIIFLGGGWLKFQMFL